MFKLVSYKVSCFVNIFFYFIFNRVLGKKWVVSQMKIFNFTWPSCSQYKNLTYWRWNARVFKVTIQASETSRWVGQVGQQSLTFPTFIPIIWQNTATKHLFNLHFILKIIFLLYIYVSFDCFFFNKYNR